MKDFNPDIADISHNIQDLAAKVEDWYKANGIDPKQNYVKGASWINFTLGVEYYNAARKLLEGGNILGGGSVLRSLLENSADIFFIVCDLPKMERRAKAYVESIDAYRDAMKGLGSDVLEKMGERPLRELNSWTDATIHDRLLATGDSLVFVYDIFSYLSHPNPASMLLITNEPYKNAQINVLQQANEFTMLNVIAVTLNHSDIDTITIDELQDLATKLGTTLIEQPN